MLIVLIVCCFHICCMVHPDIALWQCIAEGCQHVSMWLLRAVSMAMALGSVALNKCATEGSEHQWH